CSKTSHSCEFRSDDPAQFTSDPIRVSVVHQRRTHTLLSQSERHGRKAAGVYLLLLFVSFCCGSFHFPAGFRFDSLHRWRVEAVQIPRVLSGALPFPGSVLPDVQTRVQTTVPTFPDLFCQVCLTTHPNTPMTIDVYSFLGLFCRIRPLAPRSVGRWAMCFP